MEKVTQFLEKHVQWIVLGLAVLFLGYMAYENLLLSPVKVAISGRELLPSEVNEEIVRGPVARINADLNKDAPPMPVDDFVAVFRANMGMAGPQFAMAAKPLPAPVFPGAGKVKDPEVFEEGESGVKIAELPKLPKPGELKNSSGITVAQQPNPNAIPGQPGVAAAPAPLAGGDVKQVIKTMDVDWYTLMGTIDAAALQKAWFAAYGDPQKLSQMAPELVQQLFRTQFLRVEMERDEQLPNGEWANKPVIVPALKLYKLEALPPADGSVEARLKYFDWAQKNEETLARPAFYEWGQKGKAWYAPGQEPKPDATPAITPIPPQSPYPYPPRYNPGGFGPRSMGPRRGAPSNGAAMLAGLSDRRSVRVIPVSGGGPYGGGPYGGYRPGGYPYGRGGPGGYPYGPGGPGAYRPITPGYQPGFQPSFSGGGNGIDVATLQQPVQFWAHDETAAPGKTYRYRIRYSLFNPVHGAPQLVKDPKLADTLYVTSPWSDWTAPVKVGERVKFWLAQNPNPREAKFDVYTWQDGTWKNRKEPVQPGDPIAGTQWVLVDLRQNARGGGMSALLVNSLSGVTEVRSYRRDAEDPDRVNLEQETTAAAGAASAR
jgi:hypothetical protein